MLNALEIEKEMTKRNAEDNGKNVTVVDGKVGVSVASDTHWPRRGGGGAILLMGRSVHTLLIGLTHDLAHVLDCGRACVPDCDYASYGTRF